MAYFLVYFYVCFHAYIRLGNVKKGFSKYLAGLEPFTEDINRRKYA